MASVRIADTRAPVLRESTGERITRLRAARGWTQRDLAIEANVHVQSVSRAERDHTIYAWVLADLADALDVSMDVLYRGEEDRS